MRRVPKPDRTVPFLDQSGNISQGWDDFLRDISARNPPAFSTTAPTNGQAWIYDSATQLWVPGAN